MGGAKKDRTDILFRRAYREVLNRHKKRWEGEDHISFAKFKTIVVQPCVYCGHLGSNTVRDYGSRGKALISDTVLLINGVDRIDSSKGYTSDNSASCCLYCNRGKNDRKLKYFLHWIAEVYHKSVKGTENDLDLSE